MEIKKQIQTKYGAFEAEFMVEDGVWVASAEYEKTSAIVQENSFEEALEKLIELFECVMDYKLNYDNNPHKDKMDKILFWDLIYGKHFYETYKNQ